MHFYRLIATLCAAAALAGCVSKPEYQTADYPPLSPADAALFRALRLPEPGTVETALQSGASVGSRDKDGASPLLLAVADGRPEIIRQILARNPDLNAQTRNGSTPLLLAAAASDPAALKLLLAHRPAPVLDLANQFGWTPLMQAARLGHLDNVKLLAEAGAKLDLRDTQGRNAAMFAAAAPHNSRSILAFLVDQCKLNPAAMDDHGRTPAIWACMAKNTDAALFLIDRFPDARHGDDSGVIGVMTLKQAIYFNQQAVVERLIRRKVPLNADLSQVYLATKRFNVNGVHEFFARNHVVQDGKSSLFWAAEKNNLEIVRMLIKAGADPFQRDNAGNYACDYASDFMVVREFRKVMH